MRTKPEILAELTAANPVLTSIVNGQTVTMSDADRLATLDRWAGELLLVKKPQLPDVENYQVRAWMIRGGLDPDSVPQIIAAVVPEDMPGGINRAEALMRWEYAVRVPRDFGLVNVIGAQMGLTPEQIDNAWGAIGLL